MRVGLVGICSASVVSYSTVEHMYSALHRIPNATRARVQLPDGSCLQVRLPPWVSPDTVFAESANASLLCIGEARAGGQTLCARELLERWHREGERFLAHLGGSFVLVLWDNEPCRLLVVTDRLGMEKLFYAISGGVLLLATELAALRQASAHFNEVDEYSVAEFLTASHLIGRRSLVKGVQLLPPATIGSWTNGRWQLRSYWRPRAGFGPTATIDAWVERLRTELSKVLDAKCAAGELLLPLSGGLDSRCVAAFMPSAARSRTHAYSLGPLACNDVRYGRALARELNIAHTRLSLPSDFYREDLTLAQTLSDGEISIEALPLLQLRHVAHPQRVMLHGFLGDVLSGGHLLPTSVARDPAAAQEALWRQRYVKLGFDEAGLRRVLVPERAHVIGAMRQLVADALAAADAEHFEERALLVELEHRQARYVSYLQRSMSAYGPAWSPFLEPEVLDAFLDLPLAHRRGQHAYRVMLRMQSPALAGVPEATTERPVTDFAAAPRANKPARFAQTPGLWRLHRMSGAVQDWAERLAGGWVSQRRRKHYVQLEDLARRTDPHWFRARLEDPRLTDGWFQPKALHAMFEEHLRGQADHSVRLNNVVAFLEWRRTTGM